LVQLSICLKVDIERSVNCFNPWDEARPCDEDVEALHPVAEREGLTGYKWFHGREKIIQRFREDVRFPFVGSIKSQGREQLLFTADNTVVPYKSIKGGRQSRLFCILKKWRTENSEQRRS